MTADIANVRLTIKSGNRNYFSTRNINPAANDTALRSLAQAINSVQNMPYDKIVKTVDYILVQP